MAESVSVAPDALQDLGEMLVRAMGGDNDDIAAVPAHLVRANLMGHDSHGMGMMPAYGMHVRQGLLKPCTKATLSKSRGAVLAWEGGKGFGQRVAREAVAGAIGHAHDMGCALFTLAGAHHVGRVGTYGEQALAAGMGGIFFVSVEDHPPLVAPHGGTDARFGTNPVCIALPGLDPERPFLLDMATSHIALGKARVAMNKGVEVPSGTLIDAQGKPTRDPKVMFSKPQGALTTTGAYKGYGLALACELLAGVLSGNGTIHPGNPRNGGVVNAMFGIIFALDAMAPSRAGGWLAQETGALLDYVCASPASADGPATYPGEPERASLALRSKQGIPIDPTTWEELLKTGEAFGISRESMNARATR